MTRLWLTVAWTVAATITLLYLVAISAAVVILGKDALP